MKTHHLRMWLTFSLILILSACSGQRVLMPTPNVYIGETDHEIYTGLPDELKNTEVPLIYVTDRVPEKDENGKLVYGWERSASLALETSRLKT